MHCAIVHHHVKSSCQSFQVDKLTQVKLIVQVRFILSVIFETISNQGSFLCGPCSCQFWSLTNVKISIVSISDIWGMASTSFNAAKLPKDFGFWWDDLEVFVLSLCGLKAGCCDNVDISINQCAISCRQPWNVKLPIFLRCSTETWIYILSKNCCRNGSNLSRKVRELIPILIL